MWINIMFKLSLNLLYKNTWNVAKNFSLKSWSVKITQLLLCIITSASALGSVPQILIDYHCWFLFFIHLLHITNFFSNKNKTWVLNGLIVRKYLYLCYDEGIMKSHTMPKLFYVGCFLSSTHFLTAAALFPEILLIIIYVFKLYVFNFTYYMM
jgi:hypothetical protein